MNLIGQWAAQADLQVELTGLPRALVALCPDPQVRPSRLTMRAVVTDDGMGDATVALEVCRLDLPTITGSAFRCPMDPAATLDIAILTSDAFGALLPTLDVRFDTGLPVTNNGGTAFRPNPFVLTMGANLMDDEPLPRWDLTLPNCATAGDTASCVPGYESLFDEDGDGNLGVTLLANSGDGGLVAGEAYVAVRIAPSFDGRIQNSNCVDGTVSLNLDFSIVDSDVRVVGLGLATGAVTQNIPPLDFLPTSGFKLLRADEQGLDFDDDNDGTVTCAEILNNEGQFQR
ncbi:MAG: hypothetical protein KC593_00515 [Myxococcales bacterium]|nr:hypothetical protein [Myxococcales bacterium]